MSDEDQNTDPELFRVDVVIPELSQTYSNPSYRASAEEPARWLKSKTQIDCDECVAVQFETKGKYGPRRKSQQRRGFTGGPYLRLCSAHAIAWRERDEADGAPS